jgi:hypothetical protein
MRIGICAVVSVIGCFAAFAGPAGAQGLTVLSDGGAKDDNSGDVPACPSDAPVCHFDEIHFDTSLCPSFSGYGGKCFGQVYGPAAWRTNDAYLRWGNVGGGRHVEIWGTDGGGSKKYWDLDGFVPGPGSADFSFDKGYNIRGGFPDLRWRTENGGRAGTLDGPLNFNFDNGVLGADVYIYGYLYLRPQ